MSEELKVGTAMVKAMRPVGSDMVFGGMPPGSPNVVPIGRTKPRAYAVTFSTGDNDVTIDVPPDQADAMIAAMKSGVFYEIVLRPVRR